MAIFNESQGAVLFFPHDDLGDVIFCHESGHCCVGSVISPFSTPGLVCFDSEEREE